MREGYAPKRFKHLKMRKTSARIMVPVRDNGRTNLINIADIFKQYNMNSHD
jgi:hypothetical protein